MHFGCGSAAPGLCGKMPPRGDLRSATFHKGCLPPPIRLQSAPVNNAPPLSPDAILQTAFGFWGSKVLLTAVEFGLFTTLGERRLTGAQLGSELQLHARGIADFFDALVAMKFLDRDGDGDSANCSNTPAG